MPGVYLSVALLCNEVWNAEAHGDNVTTAGKNSTFSAGANNDSRGVRIDVCVANGSNDDVILMQMCLRYSRLEQKQPHA